MNLGVVRRVEDAFDAIRLGRTESAALHLFPAIDATARARRPTESVGARFRALIQDQIGIIAPLGLSVVLGRDCTFGGIALEDALYKLGRCTLLHEAGLSDSFAFSESRHSMLGGKWLLSHHFLCALLVSVVTARENRGLAVRRDFSLNILGSIESVNDLWGEEDRIRELIAAAWPTMLDLAPLRPYAT